MRKAFRKLTARISVISQVIYGVWTLIHKTNNGVKL
jgi:hypothetical protein